MNKCKSFFFESEIKLSYISSSGVCGRSREDAFGAKQHDFLWRLIEESNPLLWRYYQYFRFFFFFGNYIHFFFPFLNILFFKYFNTFKFFDSRTSIFFSSVIWLSNDFQFQINQNNTKFRTRISNWYIPWPSFLKRIEKNS